MTSTALAAATVTMPSLGEDVSEGTLSRWLKAPGDTVEVDEPLLEVATDKVDTEIPSPVAGTLVEVLAAEGDTVAVGAPLARIGSAASPSADRTPPVPEPATTAPVVPQRAPTPAVDADGRVERLPRIRQTIARRMLESLHSSAQLTTVVEADVTGIARLRAAHKEEFHRRTGTKLSFLPFFVKATVEALGEYPLLNASVNAECTEVTYHPRVHLGMAVDSPKGLMVPVIRDAQALGLVGLASAIAQSAERVRAGTISVDELVGGTFTVTNTGSRGALFDTPIINQPQSGILGTGAVVERVVPRRDSIGATVFDVRSMVYLSISYDHRIVDGADADAARFVGAIKDRLTMGFTAQDLA
jgi:2-oxoglutarate dehydrogenase E2 component (dihydrolipoamide succinyltransferase)